ncbi:MAG: UDP-N-acetylmuramoyl-L-alanyl-D-glutamate--2,6-diaminopimelate ligase [Holosporales bacterium]|jgi:UDP-N-acetylmuramoyl-L-alanyl-D-glutamate--2,6-diaminopimelate ligase|nr:UDP-N-acetylmuramoyl-L-alanyl-D-glutamate--2,6-diaminopimelate ligase [Holosporales bacterium]
MIQKYKLASASRIKNATTGAPYQFEIGQMLSYNTDATLVSLKICVKMKRVQTNSKLVERGDIFIGIPCASLAEHIEEAIRNGASITFAEGYSENQAVVPVRDARLLASRLAKFTYNEQPECCVALTGTNGKSSTAHFLRQIWGQSGKLSANLGTCGLFIADQNVVPPSIHVPTLTTPDPITLHMIMKYLYQNNVTHLVFEASSPALDQKRLHSVELSAAAFTNLASDHIDYHGTADAYFRAKLLLFEEILPRDRPAVVSADHSVVYDAVSKLNNNIITFGLSLNNFIRAENVVVSRDGTSFDLICGKKRFNEIHVDLLGKFQIMNLMCAVATAYACGTRIDTILNALRAVYAADGIMEYVRTVNGGDVYVDFAHTAEGLAEALRCFREICRRRLICVFGCGGDRDRSKRATMGRIANELADIVIVTDDNPRLEDPAAIRASIIEQCPGAIEIWDRREAIYHAIGLIEPGDIVAIMGKGHENYQTYNTESKHFNDKEEILERR